jgi:peptidoglycan/LPS O-acetylase OafA/YrhL
LSSNQNSLISVDVLRGIAALGVFYYHQHIGFQMAHYSGLKWLVATDNFGATYAVPLFFLISGYCIHLSNIKHIKAGQRLPLKEYFNRRFFRIYPPYLVALILSIAVNRITHYTEPINKTDFWVHLFLLQGFTADYFNNINPVLWTISVEMALYILYPVFYYLRLNLSLNYALAVVLLISMVSIAFFTIKGNTNNAQNYCVFNIWFAWCCGAYLADKKILDEAYLKKHVFKFIYSLILVMFFLFTFYLPGFVIITYQLNILLWTAPLLFIINQEKWLSKQGSVLFRIIAMIGLSSYSLYLFHDPLIALKNFLAHHFLSPQFQLAAMTIGILIIPVITWYSYLYIEKPFIKKQKLRVNA